MTLAQLRTALQARGYGTDTATSQTEAINGRYRELMAMHRWSFNDGFDTSLATTAGSRVVDISALTGLGEVNSVRLWYPDDTNPTEQYELDYLDPQEFRTRLFTGELGLADETGTPLWWTQSTGPQGSIELLPAPDRVYTVDIGYNQLVTDLSADADVPAFPLKYHDILVWGAIVDLAYRERDFAGSSFAQQQYDTRLREMERRYGVRQKQSATQVRRSAFWDQVGRGSGGWGH